MTSTQWLGAVVFALSCNVDTLLLAMGGTLRGGRAWLGLQLAAVTTAVTHLSLRLGAATLLWPGVERLGRLSLLALGSYTLLKGLGELWKGEREELPQREEGARGERGRWLYLSAALALNNAGAGLCAGISGLNIPLADGCTFLVTLLALAVGRHISARSRGGWSRWATPLSGLLLILLGTVR